MLGARKLPSLLFLLLLKLSMVGVCASPRFSQLVWRDCLPRSKLGGLLFLPRSKLAVRPHSFAFSTKLLVEAVVSLMKTEASARNNLKLSGRLRNELFCRNLVISSSVLWNWLLKESQSTSWLIMWSSSSILMLFVLSHISFSLLMEEDVKSDFANEEIFCTYKLEDILVSLCQFESCQPLGPLWELE